MYSCACQTCARSSASSRGAALTAACGVGRVRGHRVALGGWPRQVRVARLSRRARVCLVRWTRRLRAGGGLKAFGLAELRTLPRRRAKHRAGLCGRSGGRGSAAVEEDEREKQRGNRGEKGWVEPDGEHHHTQREGEGTITTTRVKVYCVAVNEQQDPKSPSPSQTVFRLPIYLSPKTLSRPGVPARDAAG